MGTTASKSPGRPIGFDRKRALDRAMHLFWEKGYEGTSISDLTAAMSIRPPSLYAAFGNKQALFEESLEHYLSGPVSYMARALAAPTAYEVVSGILLETARFLTRRGIRCGCMTIEPALLGSEESASARQALQKVRRQLFTSLHRRLERAKSEGDLPETADPASLARFIITVFQGLTIQAIDGAKRNELIQVAEMALSVWPRPPRRKDRK